MRKLLSVPFKRFFCLLFFLLVDCINKFFVVRIAIVRYQTGICWNGTEFFEKKNMNFINFILSLNSSDFAEVSLYYTTFSQSLTDSVNSSSILLPTETAKPIFILLFIQWTFCIFFFFSIALTLSINAWYMFFRKWIKKTIKFKCN